MLLSKPGQKNFSRSLKNYKFDNIDLELIEVDGLNSKEVWALTYFSPQNHY